jgi:hypothetical protein
VTTTVESFPSVVSSSDRLNDVNGDASGDDGTPSDNGTPSDDRTDLPTSFHVVGRTNQAIILSDDDGVLYRATPLT